MANLQDITNRSEVGTIKPWPKAAAPNGYVLCDGSAISRTDFADLFAVIGTTYGVGNGSTTFNVPDLQGKFPQGKSGTTSLAGTGGANTVTVAVTNNQAVSSTSTQSVTITGSISNTSLTTAQLPDHGSSHGFGRQTGGNPLPVPAGGRFDLTQLGGAVIQGYPSNFPFPAGTAMSAGGGSGTGHNHSHTLSGTLTGNVTSTLTGAVTAAGTNAFSPFVIVNYIIKH